MHTQYMQIDCLWRNARIATMAAQRPGLGVIERGAIAAAAGRIVWCDNERDLPNFASVAQVVDCEGRWITPGLIDCHTHLVYAGDRAREFELRLAGASYAEIAAAGGGIRATVAATRAASESELLAQSLARLDEMIATGVTTVEVKSGYGLELATEQRQLRAARRLGDARDVGVVTTFLGAHATPPDDGSSADTYLDTLCSAWIPAVAAAALADSVDAYCEHLAFSTAQVRRVFMAARAAGLAVRLHADQLSNMHAASLAAEFGALSADHLEHTDEAGIAALARAGTVAVLLPGAFYFLREQQLPPLSSLRRHGAPIAVATDCNPGTSPLTSLLLAMNMAATLFGMTVDECLLGVTRHAARALGRADSIGTLESGKQCDLAIWDVERLAELVYRMGASPLHARVWRGRAQS